MSADDLIVLKLKLENKLFKTEKYDHSYPHCWRTDKPIIYYPLDSWFFKTTAIKDRLIELNKSINWKLVGWLGVGSVAFVLIGAWLTQVVSFTYAKTMLGLFLVAFAVYFLKNPEANLKPTRTDLIWTGSMAGFMAGFIGTGGAIRGLALTAYQLEKNFFVGTSG